jgi:membrane-associated HD superfamily phosphohydrolase
MKVTLTTDSSQSDANTANDRASTVTQSVQSGLAKTQDTVQSGLAKAQDTLQMGLSTAQDVLQSGLDLVQDTWAQSAKKANKNLKKAQKKMKRRSVQDNVQSGLSTAQNVLQSGLDVAQDVWTRNVKKANKNLKKAGKSIKDVQETVQDQLASYARKRRRAKMLFRLGLLVGVMLAFLYTPWPGADIRRRLSVWWQQVLAVLPEET